MLLRIFARLRGGVRIAQRVAEVARIEQSEAHAIAWAWRFAPLSPTLAEIKLALAFYSIDKMGVALNHQLHFS